VRKQNPFLSAETRLDVGGKVYARKYYSSQDFSLKTTIQHIPKALMLCASLFLLWYIIMLMIDWYDPALHLFATFSSAVMVSTGNSWGVIEKIIK
jgi:hypothetical protein